MDQSQLLKGVLEPAVLAVIARGETYGYEIISTLEIAGFDGVGDASVYGTLRRPGPVQLSLADGPRP